MCGPTTCTFLSIHFYYKQIFQAEHFMMIIYCNSQVAEVVEPLVSCRLKLPDLL